MSRARTEDEILDLLWADFRDDLQPRLHFVAVHHKGDLHGDIQDSLLWHFTRLTVLEAMVKGRQIWLSDLTKSNDEDEIRFGLRHVAEVLSEIAPRWANKDHAQLIKQLAVEVIDELDDSHALYGFCMSEDRDLVHHWGAYGGGLQIRPDPLDPYVGVGFDARAMAFPLDFTPTTPPVFLFNVAFGSDSARKLCNYWAIKARKILELLDAGGTLLSPTGAARLIKECLLLACALVKADGWRGEEEFRMLFLPDVGDALSGRMQDRPIGRGSHVTLAWDRQHSPIRAVMPHPLAAFGDVERRVRSLRTGASPRVLRSALRPRPLM